MHRKLNVKGSRAKTLVHVSKARRRWLQKLNLWARRCLWNHWNQIIGWCTWRKITENKENYDNDKIKWTICKINNWPFQKFFPGSGGRQFFCADPHPLVIAQEKIATTGSGYWYSPPHGIFLVKTKKSTRFYWYVIIFLLTPFHPMILPSVRITLYHIL